MMSSTSTKSNQKKNFGFVQLTKQYQTGKIIRSNRCWFEGTIIGSHLKRKDSSVHSWNTRSCVGWMEVNVLEKRLGFKINQRHQIFPTETYRLCLKAWRGSEIIRSHARWNRFEWWVHRISTKKTSFSALNVLWKQIISNVPDFKLKHFVLELTM